MTEGDYEVVVVGGGPAGLTAALYATRFNHRTALVDRGGGRAAMMLDTHNVVGVTEDISGNEFLATATDQVASYGADVYRDGVSEIRPADDESDARFRVVGDEVDLTAERVVLATGFTDATPDPPLPRTGRGLHYCLHCDAGMFVDEPVYVMGHGESAAHVAMIMLNFTDDVDLLLRGRDPEWSDETDRQLRAHPVDVVEAEVESTFSDSAESRSAHSSSGRSPRDDGDSEWLGGFEFADGTRREYRGGFAMYGANYNNELAADLGCELNDDGTVAVDDHGRTSVDGVYAVGDLTPGHNQVPVAMGEGANAGIAIHKELRTYPRPLDELEAGTDD